MNFYTKQARSQAGFTLIELLVVISIISLLSSVIMAGLNNAKMKARDAQRIADLEQIRLALELFFDDNGYYPQADCGWDCNGYRYGYNSSSWDLLAADLAPYIAKLPKDPINSHCVPWSVSVDCFSYTYGNVGRYLYEPTYDLTARLEDTSHPERCGVKGWKFYFDDRYWCQAFGGPYPDQIYEASPD
jgi:general secretion pathway protein G